VVYGRFWLRWKQIKHGAAKDAAIAKSQHEVENWGIKL
jgi:hypothetical protein